MWKCVKFELQDLILIKQVNSATTKRPSEVHYNLHSKRGFYNYLRRKSCKSGRVLSNKKTSRFAPRWSSVMWIYVSQAAKHLVKHSESFSLRNFLIEILLYSYFFFIHQIFLFLFQQICINWIIVILNFQYIK